MPIGTRRTIVGSAWVAVLFLTLCAGPAYAHVALDYPNGGETLEVGSLAGIAWHDVVSHGSATYDLWYSVNGSAGPWIVIASGLPPSGSYDWVVPDTPSDQVRVRVLQDNADQDYVDISDSDLAIVNSSMALHAVLDAEKDATIYDDGDGTNANGSGSFIFAGLTAESAERRALLAFPVTSDIPEGSTITSVNLELTLSKTVSGAQSVSLYRLLEEWNEGPSDPSGNEGRGTSAVTGDVTWMHREFSGSLWTTPGASFAESASAAVQVAGLGGYTFSSTPELIADVQGWLDDPSSNYGWVVVLDSPPSGSAKRFNSRENGTANSRPKLTISYQAGGEGPTAGFSFTPAHPQPGEEVRFSDESTGEPTGWLWDFGDGQTSGEQNPSYTFTTSGSKTVTLVVSNGVGSDSVVKKVPVGATVRRPSRRVVPVS